MERCRPAGRRTSDVAGGALLVAALAVSIVACSRGGEPAEDVWARELGTAETGAASVLRDIGEAREDIQRHEPLEAEWTIERADWGLDILERSTPAAEPFGSLWLVGEELEYERPPAAALSDLELLSTVVDELESHEGPLPAVREQLAQVRRSIDSGDRQAARRELAKVTDLLLTQTQGLPFASARRHLVDARLALRRADLKAADTSLQGAEKAMASFVRMIHSPLRVARRSLYGAAADLAAENPGLAQRRLNLARSSLQLLAADKGYSGRDEAADMASDVERLERRLARVVAETRGELAGLAERARSLPPSIPDSGATIGKDGSEEEK